MAGTTYKLIRQRQLEVIRGLELAVLPAEKLRPWEPTPADLDFADWADAAGGGAFRVFELEHDLNYEGEQYLDQETENVAHSQSLLVAYPALREYMGERLDDIIDADITDLTKAIGQRGYGEYSALGAGLHNAVRVGTLVTPLEAARILRITFRLEYDRSIP